MIKKHRTWINLWHDEDGDHCVITKVIIKDGKRRDQDMFFRPSIASAIRLANIVYNCVIRGGEGQICPSTIGIGWSWRREK